jgi:hypothetical protein
MATRPLALSQGDGERAVLEARVHLGLIDLDAKQDATHELAVEVFAELTNRAQA